MIITRTNRIISDFSKECNIIRRSIFPNRARQVNPRPSTLTGALHVSRIGGAGRPTLGRKYNYRRLSRFHCAASARNARKRNGWRADRRRRGFHSSGPRASRIGIDAAPVLTSPLPFFPSTCTSSCNALVIRRIISIALTSPPRPDFPIFVKVGVCLGNGEKNLLVF